VQRRIQGNYNLNGLSEVGRRQAELLGRRLERMDFDSVFCSSVQRAVETAEIALGESSDINYRDDLREISFGSWEGKLIEEIRDEFPGRIENWFEKPTSVSIERGEALTDFRDRVVEAFEVITGGKESGNLLVITHGGVICTYLTELLGMDLDDLWSFSLPNASLTTVTLEFRKRLRLFGDTSHLDGQSIGFDGMPSVYDS
jgi:broad specificity phosphatase PhoE